MANEGNPRKTRRKLKKLKRKSGNVSDFLQSLSDDKYKAGTSGAARRAAKKASKPNKTPQTGVMGNPIPTGKSGEPQSQRKGTPAMADSQGRPMRRGQQRRALRRVRRKEG